METSGILSDRAKHRSGLGIMLAILNAINQMSDARIGALSRITNMAHYALMNRLEIFVEEGFVVQLEINEQRKGHRCKVWKLTEKGIEFTKAMEKYADTIERMVL